MAKLPRILQKIFGSSGGSSDFGQIGSKAAGSPVTTKDLDTIQALSQYDTGLTAIVAGGDSLPRLEDINALYFLYGSQIKYLGQAGIPEWIATEDYYNTASFCQRNGVLYLAVSDTTGDDPTTDTTGANWVPYNKPLELANNDISAGNETTDLSTYVGVWPDGVKVKVSWSGGDGTYTHTFTGAGYTIGGNAIADYTGKGTGSIVLELSGTDWLIIEDIVDKVANTIKVANEYLFDADTELDYSSSVTNANTITFTELPANTIAVKAYFECSRATAGGTNVYVTFKRNSGDTLSFDIGDSSVDSPASTTKRTVELPTDGNTIYVSSVNNTNNRTLLIYGYKTAE